MATALGMFTQRLDEKGRLILPAKARLELGEGTYLSRGQDHCIYLFSASQFDDYKTQTREHAPQGMAPMAFDRIFFSSIITQTPDKQGRVTIPAQLREYAGLDREITVVGLETRMEVWDTNTWNAYVEQYEAAFAALSEGLR